jgi:ribosome-associated toxin RatA of RatAB toxin-antitoxin module
MLEDRGLKDVKISQVSQVMKDNLDMTYRKIVKTPISANNDRNRIMRKQASHKLFHYIKRGWRCISLDESWVGGSNYSRRAWKPKHETNS